MKKTLRETLTKESSSAEIFGEIRSRTWAMLNDGIEPKELNLIDFERMETDSLEDLYVIAKFSIHIAGPFGSFGTVEECDYLWALETVLKRRGYETGYPGALYMFLSTILRAAICGSSPAAYDKLVDPQIKRSMEIQRERQSIAA